jgi:hypothetical protein
MTTEPRPHYPALCHSCIDSLPLAPQSVSSYPASSSPPTITTTMTTMGKFKNRQREAQQPRQAGNAPSHHLRMSPAVLGAPQPSHAALRKPLANPGPLNSSQLAQRPLKRRVDRWLATAARRAIRERAPPLDVARRRWRATPPQVAVSRGSSCDDGGVIWWHCEGAVVYKTEGVPAV